MSSVNSKMTKFSITFICSLSADLKTKGKKEKKEKSKKKKKHKKEAEIVEPKINCINVGNVNGFMHIVFNLIPTRPPCVIDVVSWGPVAKVIFPIFKITFLNYSSFMIKENR